ncbi:MAG: DMT family transporter [Shimia sp.]
MGRDAAGLIGILVATGAGWGLTLPLSKVAVSTGYGHFGLIFWQLALGALLLGAFTLTRGKGLPTDRKSLGLYLMIAFVGTIVPNSASYQALVHLPAGLMSILLSIVPMLAFPVALALGTERFRWTRLLGLACGLVGVLLIVAPDAALPEAAMYAWVPVALIAPLCYAFEGNLVAKIGLGRLDAVQALFGASLIGTVVALPLALGSGQFIDPIRPWGAPEWALVASGAIHAVVYSSYVWMVGRAGPIFSAQVSYLVTGFGVVWALLLFRESYSAWVWTALGVMFVGLFLVQPRPRLPVVDDATEKRPEPARERATEPPSEPAG